MEINWLGHSSISINSRDIILITDPFDNSDGEFFDSPKADIVTVSNDDPKHSNVSGVKGTPKIISGPGEYEIKHFYLTGIGSGVQSQDNSQNEPVNTIYSIKVEGLIICHIGNLKQKLTPAQFDQIGKPHVLLLPMPDQIPFNNSNLQELITSLQPRIIIPITTNDYISSEESGTTKEAFISELGGSEIQPQNRLNVTDTNLPPERKVILLNKS
ncbi:MAG: MBL fold metallo-hydrolase [SAR202 cluster bacterium]|nr:MBL fold metallo-hydrolase [SAR202 cluster bacterium]|tara:strand:+ start:365 stop:1006 length:642 start_codon:yes stop_codon:yes gene_type:complete